MKRSANPSLRSLTLVLVLGLTIAAMAPATEFPARVPYEGLVVDAHGQPLAGPYPVVLSYYDTDGNLLFEESMAGVQVQDGVFEIDLGTGKAVGGLPHPSLRSTFAAHPRVELGVSLGNTAYGPRVGILPAGHSLKSRLVLAGLRPAEDDELHWKGYESRGGVTAFQATTLSPTAGSSQAQPTTEGQVWSRPFTLPVVGPKLSRAARDLPVITTTGEEPAQSAINPPRHEALFDDSGRRFGTIAPKSDDPLATTAAEPTGAESPALIRQFEGLDVNGFLPPDSEGAVGPLHYVQMVNVQTAIFDKAGNLRVGPFNTNLLWSGFGGVCETLNNGDAIALYDEQANRWVLTQFAVAGGANSVCFAVSQTDDPTGAYYLYQFVTPRFPDYYKLGVWPAGSDSAYFMSTNSGFQGAYDVFALDRDNMLAGNPVTLQLFQSFPNLLMPADNDGPTPPPAGNPGIFYSFRDGGASYFGNPPTDSIDIYEFDVDWATPANSTFTLVQTITPAQGLVDFNWTVCGFFVQNCIPQPTTAQGLDSASWWPMQRLVYRNFGTSEVLVGSWTVDVLASGDRAAPRWFVLERTGGPWAFDQQGTYSPDAIHRWMPSIGMDRNRAVALGFSAGDGSNFASIYYATREAGDSANSLRAEALLWEGTGAQTSTLSRWGDYSSMEIDPVDDCTFWYQNEYLETTSTASWRTRIGAFQVTGPGCVLFSEGFELGDTMVWDAVVGE